MFLNNRNIWSFICLCSILHNFKMMNWETTQVFNRILRFSPFNCDPTTELSTKDKNIFFHKNNIIVMNSPIQVMADKAEKIF